jgi:hypothetical protein
MQYDRLVKSFFVCCLLVGPINVASAGEEPLDVSDATAELPAPELDLDVSGEALTESTGEQIEAPRTFTPTFDMMYEAKARAKRAHKDTDDAGPEA